MLYFIVVLISIINIYFFIQLAKFFNIVDKSNHRKIHSGDIPLIGGPSIYFTIFMSSFFLDYSSYFNIFFYSSFVILIIGFLDDIFDISIFFRLTLQLLSSLIVIFYTKLYLTNLGEYNSFFFNLGPLGYPFTLIAILTLTNAINFIDGMNGLSSSQIIISLITIIILANQNDFFIIDNFIKVLLISLIIFFIFNLFNKVFLGDSGSTGIGFLLSWIVIYYAMVVGVHPILVAWSISLPCFDMFRLIIKRSMLKKYFFNPDNLHIHHIILSFCSNSFITIVIITFISILFTLFGYFTFIFFNSITSFIFYIFTFFLYTFILNKYNFIKL